MYEGANQLQIRSIVLPTSILMILAMFLHEMKTSVQVAARLPTSEAKIMN